MSRYFLSKRWNISSTILFLKLGEYYERIDILGAAIFSLFGLDSNGEEGIIFVYHRPQETPAKDDAKGVNMCRDRGLEGRFLPKDSRYYQSFRTPSD